MQNEEEKKFNETELKAPSKRLYRDLDTVSSKPLILISKQASKLSLFQHMCSPVLPLLPKFRNFQEFLGFSRIEKEHFENKNFSGISSIIYN